MQEWRNWQTRRLQVPVVVKTVWVQVPSPASFFIQKKFILFELYLLSLQFAFDSKTNKCYTSR